VTSGASQVHVPAPFGGGGCDEQAEHDALWAFIGRAKAERLFALRQNSYPTPWPKGHPYARTADEVFIAKALREGFTETELEAYCHVAGIPIC